MGHVGIKVDMAKAYDRVEWGFLEKLLGVMGFPTHWISLISRCVSTVSFSILLKGFPCKPFNPERGLRHGDPLSPYLFILCVQVLSGLIIKAQERKALHGIKIARNAPEISHLLFVDDSIFFIRATRQEMEQLMYILSLWQRASGQLINLDKSELSFSQNVPIDRKNDVQGWIKIKAIESHSKYLGLPTFVGRSKKQVFEFVQQRVWKKLKGWKERSLSKAGKEVLIKSVAQPILNYIMGCFLLPCELCNKIESMISNFWWGSKDGEKKIHWTGW